MQISSLNSNQNFGSVLRIKHQDGLDNREIATTIRRAANGEEIFSWSGVSIDGNLQQEIQAKYFPDWNDTYGRAMVLDGRLSRADDNDFYVVSGEDAKECTNIINEATTMDKSTLIEDKMNALKSAHQKLHGILHGNNNPPRTVDVEYSKVSTPSGISTIKIIDLKEADDE